MQYVVGRTLRVNMTRLTARRAEQMLEGLSRLYALVPVEAFPAAVLAVIPDLIGCDSASFNEIELSTGRFRVLAEPADNDPELEQAFAQYLHQHPVIAHFGRTGDTESHAISDFIDPVEFRRLNIYDECFSYLGIDDQLSTSLLAVNGSQVIGVALNRACSFSEENRALLNAFRPHLVTAYHNALHYSRAYAARDDEELCATAKAALDSLTNRQLDVLRLIAAGRSNALVAAELGISAATVKKHVEHILDRLMVDSRLKAARLYLVGAPRDTTDTSWTFDGTATGHFAGPSR